jgi:peptide/nickel transport system substrate-binding protein
MKRRRFLNVIVASTFTSWFRADAGQQLSAKPAAPIPSSGVTRFTMVYADLIYDKLYALDESGIPRRKMIDVEEVSHDGRLCWLTLREGLHFHDGEPVRAADCVASIRRAARHHSMVSHLVRPAIDAIATDENRLQFLLTANPLALPLALSGVFIVPERIAMLDTVWDIKDCIGSGPYRIAQSTGEPNSSARCVTNELYEPQPKQISMYMNAQL